MILIANSNPIHLSRLAPLAAELGAPVIGTPSELIEYTTANQYDYIFFPHWSHIIPAEIYETQQCVVFHMTDLPYGRGGSPLQNLIVRGIQHTRISALRVSEGLDTGPIYLKRDLSLHGTAREVFLRAGEVMEQMIRDIIATQPQPVPQTGEPTLFKRRKPAQGDLSPLEELSQAYDHIRMLDADGYPPAFVETAHFRFEFFRASLHPEQILADVRITRK